MTRQTRAESQAQTRDQLLETAQRLFLSQGYAATSLEKVSAEAGFSKGAVYSNFRNKVELCLAVLDRIHEEQAAAILREVGAATTLTDRVAAFGLWAEQNIGNEPWTALEVEFATSTRTDPRARAQLADRRTVIAALLTDFMVSQAQELGVELALPAEDAALIGLSLGIGLGVQRAIDPSLAVTPLVDLLWLLLGKRRA